MKQSLICRKAIADIPDKELSERYSKWFDNVQI